MGGSFGACISLRTWACLGNGAFPVILWDLTCLGVDTTEGKVTV